MSGYDLDADKLRKFDRGLEIREKIIEMLYADGKNTDTKDLRLMKEYIESGETAVVNILNLQLKLNIAEGDNKVNLSIIELIKQKSIERAKNEEIIDVEEVKNDIKEIDYALVPGEDKMGHVKLELKEVLKNMETGDEDGI